MIDRTNASSYAAAERLIAQAAQSGARHLALHSLRITHLPPSLGKLQQLESLDIERCPWLTDISVLRELRGLRELSLARSERLVDFAPLRDLIELRALNLDGCIQFNDLVGLGRHERLRSLDLGDCAQLSNLAPLAQLSQLQSLDLAWCYQLNDLSLLEPLSQLQSLDLSFCDQLSDLSPLAQLSQLQSLNLTFCQRLNDFAPLAKLSQLQSLNLAACNQFHDLSLLMRLCQLKSLSLSECFELRDLSPLSPLSQLQSLNLTMCDQLSDLSPLSQLTQIQSLNLTYCEQLCDLSPLSQLTQIQSLNLTYCEQLCDLSLIAEFMQLQSLSLTYCEQLGDLSQLAELRNLQSLDLTHCSRLVDISPLAQFSQLRSLDLAKCDQLDDLLPLAKLSRLQSLNLSDCHQLSDLSPLAKLNQLQSLNLSDCHQLSDLSPLAKLSQLQSLNLDNCNQVNDLSPLANLNALQSLLILGLTAPIDPLCHRNSHLQRLQISDLPREAIYWHLPHLTYLGGRLTLPYGGDIPTELFDGREFGWRLDKLVPYQQDLDASGTAPVTELKLFVIGNGRVGKTQLARRLRGLDFDESVPSTHGIRLDRFALLPAHGEQPVMYANLWDFGGQDIYLGTHGLFLDERAIYVLAWHPDYENDEVFYENGVPMRNHPLGYWLAYIRAQAGDDAPIIVVQTQCDDVSNELTPLLPPHEFSQLHQCASSARSEDGMELLQPLLKRAARLLRQRYAAVKIPQSWAAIADGVQAQRDAGERLLSFAAFSASCEAQHSLAPPSLLASYLHRCGKVFWQQQAFGGALILDQQWALEGIYALLTRDKLLPILHAQHGCFTPDLLASMVWQAYSADERRLFLHLMQQCGTCFKVDQTHYIAPEMLPPLAVRQADIDAVWRDGAAAAHIRLRFAFLHEGIVRAMLSHIGEKAGAAAVYWREGVCYFDREVRGAVRISACWEPGQSISRRGEISVEVQGAQASKLAKHLADSICSLRLREAPEYIWLCGEPEHAAAKREQPAQPFSEIRAEGYTAIPVPTSAGLGVVGSPPVQRILLIATEWDSRHGGLSTFNRELCIALAKSGREVCCAVAEASEKEIAEAKSKNVNLVKANAVGGDGKAGLLCPLSLPRDFVPDIIVGHGRITGEEAKVQQAYFYQNAKRIHFLHMSPGDIEWHKGKDNAAQTAEERESIELALMRDASLVAAVGPVLTKTAIHLIAGLKKTERPTVIDFRPGFRIEESNKEPAQRFQCLMLCRAEDASLKGLDIAAAALAALAHKPLVYQPELLIRGAAPGTGTALKKQLETDHHGLKVRVMEFSADAEKIEMDLRRAALLLMPSREEGFGLVALEALRLGTPILVSDKSGFGEMLKELLPSDAEAARYVVKTPPNLLDAAPSWSEQVFIQLHDIEAANQRADKLAQSLEKELCWDQACATLLAALCAQSGVAE